MVAYGAYKYLFTGEDSIVCTAQKILFLGDLQSKISSMSGSRGYNSVGSYEFKIPCGNKAYFVDSSKKDELIASKSLEKVPLLLDAAQSGTSNFFIVDEEGRIALSRNISGLNLLYPYNLCFDSNKKVNLRILGLGAAGTQVMPECEQFECTSVPEIIVGGDLDNLLNIICQGDSSCIADERANINNAEDGVEVILKISTCYPETTRIEFIIKPKEGVEKAEDVKLIETVDKNICKFTLNDGVKVEGGEGAVIIEPDPMLVWTFPEIAGEKRVSYEIPGIISDECRQQLKAVVGAKSVKYTSKHPTKPGRTETAKEHPDRFKPERTTLPRIREEHKGEWAKIDAATKQIIKTDKDEVLDRLKISRREEKGKESAGRNEAPRWKRTDLGRSNMELGDSSKIESIYNFAEDNEQRNSQNLRYTLVDGATESTRIDKGFVVCEIKENKDIECESSDTQIGSTTINVRVRDNQNTPATPDATFFIEVRG